MRRVFKFFIRHSRRFSLCHSFSHNGSFCDYFWWFGKINAYKIMASSRDENGASSSCNLGQYF